MRAVPKISVITPSYNHGEFIEETIVSVIGQNYTNLEYIVIDGGSTDNTVDIIKKYEKYISYWISEKDNGQSEAINKGFSKATGEIIGWLNSDDLYMPGCLIYMSEIINLNISAIYFGNCISYREDANGVVSWGSQVELVAQKERLENIDYIKQSSSFWTKNVLEAVGILREDMHFAFDWEWFLRAKQKKILFQPVSKCLSLYRHHELHKTGSGGLQRQAEILDIYTNHSQHYAKLYKMLTEEKPISSYNLIKKAWGKCMQIRYKDLKKPQSFKIMSPYKYGKYTQDEIANCFYML